MKKLLATLTSISTIGSIMPMILANASTKIENKNLQANNLERNKRETLSPNDFLEFNNKYTIKITDIDKEKIFWNSKNDFYFSKGDNIYILKEYDQIPTKIEGITGWVTKMAIDSEDNLYLWGADGLYVLKQGETQQPLKLKE